MNDKTNETNTSGERPVFEKGMTFEKLTGKFQKKLDENAQKEFEKKFEGEFKKYNDAQAIADGLLKGLEKLYNEHTSGL